MTPARLDYAALVEAVTEQDLRHLAEECGAVFRGKKGTCPACSPTDKAEANLPLSIGRKNGRVLWHCFRCESEGRPCGGDALHFLRVHRGLSPEEAAERLARLVPHAAREWRPPGSGATAIPNPSPTGSAPKSQQRGSRFDPSLWERFATSDKAGEDYLRRRGLHLESPSSLRYNVGGTGHAEADRLAEAGYRVACALRDAGGNVRAYQYRLARDAGTGEKKTLNPAGSQLRGLVFGDPAALRDAPAVLLAEGLTDYLAARVLTEDDLPVLSLPGAEMAKGCAEGLAEGLQGKRVFVATDADAAGDKAAETFAREILRRGGVEFHRLRPDMISQGAGDLADTLRDPEGLGGVRERFWKAWDEVAQRGPWDPDSMAVADGVERWLDRLERLRAGDPPPILTPWKEVNGKLGRGGLREGLYVLAGATGSGKTALSLQLAYHAAGQGHPALFVSLEVSEHDLYARLFALDDEDLPAWSRIAAATEEDLPLRMWQRLHEAAPAWKERQEGRLLEIFCPVDERATVGEIRAEVERIAARHGRPPFVVVDYIQRLASPDSGIRGDAIRVRVTENAKRLRTLARETGSVVWAVSSIGRDSYKEFLDKNVDPDKLLQAFKESGDVEFSAVGALALHRNGKAAAVDGRAEMRLLCMKHSYGRSRWGVDLRADLARGEFKEAT